MRARTRLLLDVVIAAAFVVAFNPAWTGIPLHQWLSIAVIAPLVVHLVVNWEWAMRVIATFFKKLLSVSRLNLVVDVALLVATITVMLSGFMVSPALFAPFGVRFTTSVLWIAVHSWSADATIALFALHAGLHWKWALGVARRWASERSAMRPVPRTAAIAAAVVEPARRSPSARRSAARSRRRSQQAAAERAMVRRTVSALGLSVFVGAAVFASVGLAQPTRPAPHAAAKVASSVVQRCPVTGCTASTCHAATGARAEAFYGKARVAAWKARSAAGAHQAASHGSPSGKGVSARTAAAEKKAAARKAAAKAAAKKAASKVTARKAAAKKAAAKKAAAKKAAAMKAAAARKKAAAKKKVRRRSCPVTGCSATTCHGAHGVSARVWYATH